MQARMLIKEGRREEAITKLTEYLRNNSTDEQGYLLLSKCYVEISQPGRAAEILQEAIRITPGSVEAHIDLARLEAALSKDQAAQEEFHRALEIAPNNKEALMGLGKLYIKTRNYSEALPLFVRSVESPDAGTEAWTYVLQCGTKVKDTKVVENALEKLLQLAPRDAALHDRLGNWLSEDGFYAPALKEFTLALQLEPSSEKIRYNLATLHLRMNQPEKAIALLADPPKSPKVNAAYHYLLGQCHEKAANGMEAYREYQAAIEADPGEQVYFLSLASLLISQNVPNAAYVVLTSALKRFPSSAPVRIAMGLLELRRSNLESALKYHQEAVTLDPGSLPARKLLGRIQFAQANYPEAIRTFAELERLSPNDPQPYFLAGMAYMKLPDKTDLALESFLHSLRLSPQTPSPYYWLGMIYSQRKRDYRLAVKYLEEALSRNPNMTAAYQLLIQSYRLLGDETMANKVASRYREALQRNQNQTEPGEPQ